MTDHAAYEYTRRALIVQLCREKAQHPLLGWEDTALVSDADLAAWWERQHADCCAPHAGNAAHGDWAALGLLRQCLGLPVEAP
jgi:hypothetical protein